METGWPRLPLSTRESTDSCNILFSLRMIISGAPISTRWRRRLLRLMTRLYKSLISLMAKRPPSSCTVGLRSGGSTGRTVKIIHSGLLPLRRKASITCNRLLALRRLCPDGECPSWIISIRSLSRLIALTIFNIASAPIPASKILLYFVFRSRYSVSVRSFCTRRFLTLSTSLVDLSPASSFSSTRSRRS